MPTREELMAAMKWMGVRTMRIGCAMAVGLVSLFMFQDVSAYEFTPTPAQWASWPPYCRARYPSTTIGASSGFSRAVSPEEVERWRRIGGERTFDAVHHYCAGIVYLEEARTESDPKKHQFLLNRALEEVGYTYERAEQESPIYPDIVIGLARVKEQLGNTAEAIKLLENVIESHPDRADLYGALAIIQRRNGKREEARATLLKGDKALDGKSAELSYNLGLISLELNDPDGAVTYAKRAYDLGYPLPGLKNKLRRMGRWTE
jgi:tetratricopeptide (TPR) repeat protein